MALNFVNGKPKKVDTPVQEPTVVSAMPALAAMFNKIDPDDGGPMLPIKLSIEAHGHVENPPVVDVKVDQTIAPEPGPLLESTPLTGEVLVKTFNPQVPVENIKAEVVFTDPAIQEKLGGVQPFTDGTFESPGYAASLTEQVDLVKLSEDQEPQSEVSEEVASSEVLAMVDEYTDLQKQIDAADVSHLIAAQDAIKKLLAVIAKSKNYADNKPVRLNGTHKNYVQFSAKSNKTEISDKAGLVKEMGVDVYIEQTNITLEAAKKVLAENVLVKYTTKVAGSRTLKEVHTGD